MPPKVLAGTLNQRTNVTRGAGWDLKPENQCHRRCLLGPQKKQRPNVTGGAGWDHKTEDQPIPPEVLAWT